MDFGSRIRGVCPRGLIEAEVSGTPVSITGVCIRGVCPRGLIEAFAARP